MRTDTPQPIRLADYRPFPFAIETTRLVFELHPSRTRVKAELSVRRTSDTREALVLNGERLKLLSVAIDGQALSANQYAIDPEQLTIHEVPDQFVLTTEVEIDPSSNKALMGLYMSGGRFCTQCEAEGFRTITYFPDRPDVLSRYSVRIEADRKFTHLLSNGNLVGSGALDDDRFFAEWTDPFPKPCYLFALVAGHLDVLADKFITMSGREVALRVFVDPGQASRAAYALDSLKRAMKWDEDTFGREYDLDLFMIVAVRDFNFGAMENKGLNIFNSSLLLADPETATDLDYERIEAVVAHEYFHNWTGNRITCRDWFQLCLKEGFTVFRDQSFSADMRGEAVQRIKEVRALRARQFAEDAGPLAHPVRPSSYLKIDNFYTATIYEKGSEIIRMLKTILGAEAFRKGCDLYFQRHDGEATTVEAFIACFAEASGRDLTDFFGWYEQAGTPAVTLQTAYDEAARALTLTLSQTTAPTPGQPTKRALPIPVAIGLLSTSGEVLRDTEVVLLDEATATVRWENVASEPVVSALRGFSAPVNLTTDARPADRYVLFASDPDLFNRWEAGQTLARDLILGRAGGAPDEVGEERYAEALGQALVDDAAEPAFKAQLLALPSEPDLALMSEPADPAALHAARDHLRARIAVHLGDLLRRLHGDMQSDNEFSASAQAAGRRALRNACAEALSADPHNDNLMRIVGHYEAARNMTDMIGGLYPLVAIGGVARDKALANFHYAWRTEPLVLDKWFSVQGRDPNEDVLERVMALTTHPDFEPTNPNRLRALVSTFANFNPARFHDPSGAGYRFLTDQILAVDAFNPMTAARMIEPLGGWRRYRPELGQLMREQLERIVAHPELSKNVLELATKALG
ncbi:aminopeptidase N [Caulobacter sp. RL271]|jgi:aminopeptidase N|uniref:Aminopeptidase N n=1 Tax=Caulobacter segnis TaxID=88688 RepID=A0ABY4ZXM7_9CAUL|nr:aminopeptidase N [Caulobacter segnis]USQ97582.1 aminopeptidase N [Caulobacter segnis]